MSKLNKLAGRLLIEQLDVSDLRGDMLNTLNDKASQIHRYARALGFDSDTVYITDPTETPLFTRVEMQLGKNNRYANSQVTSVTIYDNDDVVVELPLAVSTDLGIQNYYKFSNLNEVAKMLRQLRKSILQK